MAELDIS